MIKKTSLVGKKYGRLTVIEEAPRGQYYGRKYYICRCDCGNFTNVQARNLESGNTKSCGCLRRELLEAQTKHGGKGTPLYDIWRGMRQRCRKPSEDNARYYKNKGIRVCKEWEDFETFKKWSLNNGYIEPDQNEPFKYHLSIDRIDPNGDYCPENCRWITVSENSARAKSKKGDI